MSLAKKASYNDVARLYSLQQLSDNNRIISLSKDELEKYWEFYKDFFVSKRYELILLLLHFVSASKEDLVFVQVSD